MKREGGELQVLFPPGKVNVELGGSQGPEQLVRRIEYEAGWGPKTRPLWI